MLSPEALRSQIRSARNRYGSLEKSTLRSLVALLTEHNLSLVRGDVLLLDGRWYVTHQGLLSLARRKRCAGSMSSLLLPSAIHHHDVGRSRQPSTDRAHAEVSWATAMPIRRMSLP